MIGQKFVLWKEEYSNKAYKDQMEIWHGGYIVRSEYVVTITETKKVRGLWGDGEYLGWKAVSESGKVFTCNWRRFPDDSITPTYYWDAVDDTPPWKPVDAIQASEMFPHVDDMGNKKTPIGSSICQEHSVVFLDNCWRCEYEKIKSSKKELNDVN